MPTPATVLAVSIQITLIASAATAAAALLRHAPAMRYWLWRLVLLLCLALPWLQSPVEPALTLVDDAFVAAQATLAATRAVTPAAPPIDWTSWLTTLVASAIALRTAWLAIGYARLRRLRNAGAPAPASEHQQLQATLRTAADVRYVSTVAQPVTFGLFRPVVLLPEALQTQPPATRNAVIAHELIHVRRRDWAWVLAEEVVRTVVCFHPAIWWLISRVQLSREEVVDRTVVALTGRRREYVEALLAFADDTPFAAAPAFARRRHLFRRIVLLSTEDAMSARRLVASAVVVVVVVAATSWWSMRVFPTYGQAAVALQTGVGPLERVARPITRDNPMPARLSQVAPEFPSELDGPDLAVTVTLRMVVDDGGSVREVRPRGLTVRGSGFSATLDDGPDFMQRMDMMSRAAFAASPGQPVTSASSLKLKAFVDAAAEAVQQWRYESPREGPVAFDTTLKFESGNRVGELRPATSAEPRTADGALRVGGNIHPPRKIKNVAPVYPQDAKDANVQGVVILELRIEPDGRVSSARVLRSIPALDAAAVDAARQWEFEPTLLNGQAVPVIMTVTIQFSL